MLARAVGASVRRACAVIIAVGVDRAAAAVVGFTVAVGVITQHDAGVLRRWPHGSGAITPLARRAVGTGFAYSRTRLARSVTIEAGVFIAR